MSQDARQLLEEIAVDMLQLSMAYMGEDAIRDEARSLTDDELYRFVTEV